MKPLTFINGVIFATSVALALTAVMLILFHYILGSDASLDQAVVNGQLPVATLTRDMGIFMALAIVTGLAFVGHLRNLRWKWPAEFFSVVSVVAVITGFLAAPNKLWQALAMLAVVSAVVGGVLLACHYSGLLAHLRRWLSQEA